MTAADPALYAARAFQSAGQTTAEAAPQPEQGFVEEIVLWLSSPDDLILMATVAASVFGVLVVLQGTIYGALTAVNRRRPGTVLFLIKGLVNRVGWIFLAMLSLEVSQAAATVPAGISRIITMAFTLSAVVQGGTLIYHIIIRSLRHYIQSRPDSTTGLQNAMGLIQSVLRLTVIVVGTILVLDNLGVNVTALVAGVGIGGIAIGLAAQGIFRELFSSLSIILDKPFAVGDYIVSGDTLGTVEHIGLQTTRIRSLTGEEIVAPNSDLMSSPLRNFSTMEERRISFSLGVTYETPHAKLAAIPGMIQGIIEGQDGTRFSRCHFSGYGDFALTFDTVYFVLSPDYGTFMDIQQAVNLAIHRAFEEAGIAFAYPTQTIQLQRTGSVPDPFSSTPATA
ncbi:MAG: mechanosensitive ion channel family protein [Alphaproteobacteria bacterium]